MIKMNRNLWAVTALALLLAACAGTKRGGTGAGAAGAAGGGAGGGTTVQPNATAPVTTVTTPGDNGGSGAGINAPASRVIYFDFDQSEIRPEFNAVLTEHARALTRNASVKVRLEGHTDERGSREYNIGLGERRAQAVRRVLLLQGVTEAQLSTVSYGEEKPAVAGSNEEAWAKNRRVELVYLN
jgi:peptidoglycan-associated lipoprotein